MPVVADTFFVAAPVTALAAFHQGTHALRKLSPPPVFVQIHRVEPLAEGSVSEFTLWFGPLPLRWTAVHSSVDPASGFIDSQTAGPMATWRHRHHWLALPGGGAEMREEIAYTHKPGLNGLFTRLLFAPPLLRFMLAYRRSVIRRECELRPA